MRPVVKTDKFNDDGTPLSFTHWGDAKADLQTELGSYCSFCEREGYRSSLHVEHILAKDLKKYNSLIYRWDNFLLGCINCNSTKGSKDYDINDTYLPHLNNLLVTIEVLEGGVVRIKKDLSVDQERRTKNFIDLVGLDRDPSHPNYSDKDDRWESRIDAWNIAREWLQDYEYKEIKLGRIIQMAQAKGYWSVWMKVFNEYPEVKKELITNFAGTAANCFDKDINPMPRNGANP